MGGEDDVAVTDLGCVMCCDPSSWSLLTTSDSTPTSRRDNITLERQATDAVPKIRNPCAEQWETLLISGCCEDQRNLVQRTQRSAEVGRARAQGSRPVSERIWLTVEEAGDLVATAANHLNTGAKKKNFLL